MKTLLDELSALLAADPKYAADGKVLRNKVVEHALRLDPALLKLLLSNSATKKHFFAEVDGVFVFDKVGFQRFVSNREFLPDSFTAYKNKIGLSARDEYLSDAGEVVLAWPYKDCLLEGGQDEEDAKRSEIFWNETLAPDEIDRLLTPKVFSGFKRFTPKGTEKVTALANDNLLIKGNNLLVLHSLRKRLEAKVDCIYIDPPYNPESKANTFCYNNSFNRSTWLTFMKNRLQIAKRLLKPSGALIVAIDKNEQAYLGVLLDELFPEYEMHCITIVHNPRGVQGTNFSYTHEYAYFVLPKNVKTVIDKPLPDGEFDFSPLRNWGTESERSDAKNCFYPIIVKGGKIIGFGDVEPDDYHPKKNVKRGKAVYVYPIDRKGVERKWRYARQSVEAIQHLLKVVETDDGLDVDLGRNYEAYRTVWADPKYDANKYGTRLVKSLVPESKFDFPKSLYNVYDCLYAVVGKNKEAVILDFFGGSGTTAHAVLELNKNDGGTRRFVLCEQMHYVDTLTAKRIHAVVKQNKKDSFVYCELLSANETFVNQIVAAKDSAALKTVWHGMEAAGFLSYRTVGLDPFGDPAFAELTLKEQKKVLTGMLDMNMLYVPATEVDDESHGVSAQDKALTSALLAP